MGEAGGDVIIAMEYVDGRTLRAILDEGRPPLSEALRIAAEIARGLEKAHAAGVIHRDLKPENVIVSSDGRAKILDFGLAKLREERLAVDASGLSQVETQAKPELTREGMIVGTAAYMAPEQARGLAVDHRCDLFSLGVLLYEMTAGRNPFRGSTAIDSLSAILRDRPPVASAVNPDLPIALDRLLESLLAKDPQDRPASAASVAEELEALDLDPLSPLTHGLVGSGLYFARRYEESVTRCRRALEIDPNHVQSLFALANAAGQLGRHEVAVDAAERAAALAGRSPFFLGVLGMAYAGAGQRSEGQAALAELEERSKHESVAPLLRAWILARLGESSAALDFFEQAYAERNSLMFALAAMGEFDSLRAEARFETLLRRIGLG